MLSNRPLVVFVSFSFLNAFGVIMSDESGHNVVRKGHTETQEVYKQEYPTNQIDLNKKSSIIIHQPILFKNHTKNKVQKSIRSPKNIHHEESDKKLSSPDTENPRFGIDFGGGNTGGKKRKKQQESFMERILPLMVTPFLISSSMVPMLLIGLLHMLVKSAFIGKIGIILMILNMFTSRRNPGGVSHQELDTGNYENQVAMDHYGWHGNEEYGAYVNRKRRK